jgi:hypothetical protein
VSLLREVIAVLRRESIPHAIIGAAALSAYGVSRSTADVDLLTTDPRCLTPSPWTPLQGHCGIDIRLGDADDPLRGVVRFSRPGDLDIDIVVGRHAWQQDCVLRAVEMAVEDTRVVTLPDLVLLKLYAGGPQDAWDVHQVLGLAGAAETTTIVESRLAVLPADAIRLWRKILAERTA